MSFPSGVEGAEPCRPLASARVASWAMRIRLRGPKPPRSWHWAPSATGTSHAGSPPSPSASSPSSDPTRLSSPPPTEDTEPGTSLLTHVLLYPDAYCSPHPLRAFIFLFREEVMVLFHWIP